MLDHIYSQSGYTITRNLSKTQYKFDKKNQQNFSHLPYGRDIALIFGCVHACAVVQMAGKFKIKFFSNIDL